MEWCQYGRTIHSIHSIHCLSCILLVVPLVGCHSRQVSRCLVSVHSLYLSRLTPFLTPFLIAPCSLPSSSSLPISATAVASPRSLASAWVPSSVKTRTHLFLIRSFSPPRTSLQGGRVSIMLPHTTTTPTLHTVSYRNLFTFAVRITVACWMCQLGPP